MHLTRMTVSVSAMERREQWSLHVSSVEAREIWCAYNYMSSKARDPRVNWNDHIVHRGVHYGVCAGAQEVAGSEPQSRHGERT